VTELTSKDVKIKDEFAQASLFQSLCRKMEVTTEFRRTEWDAFKITGLRADHYVKVFGFRWIESTDASRGDQLNHDGDADGEKVAKALGDSTLLTPDLLLTPELWDEPRQWTEFVKRLEGGDHFVKVDDKCFRPAPARYFKPSMSKDRLKEHRRQLAKKKAQDRHERNEYQRKRTHQARERQERHKHVRVVMATLQEDEKQIAPCAAHSSTCPVVAHERNEYQRKRTHQARERQERHGDVRLVTVTLQQNEEQQQAAPCAAHSSTGAVIIDMDETSSCLNI